MPGNYEFYANVVGANKHLFYGRVTTNPVTLFIAWFNLDLGIETCFYDGLTAYTRTWLQFVFPVYMWSIAVGIILLAKYSKRVALMSGNNGVPVISTLFLLSYAKLFKTIISAVSYTTLYTADGPEYVWSLDGNIRYLGSKHAPLFCVAVATLIFLWLPYTLLLLLGRHLFILKCSSIVLRAKPFLDANYAPFHHRHQYWMGFTLVIKAIILLLSASLPTESAHIVVFSVTVASAVLTFWGHRVYHNNTTSLSQTFIYMNLLILNATKLFVFDSMFDISIASFTLISMQLFIFAWIVMEKMYIRVVFPLAKKMQCWKWNAEREGDDVSLGSLREDEESVGDEDRDSDSSIDSIPTY